VNRNAYLKICVDKMTKVTIIAPNNNIKFCLSSIVYAAGKADKYVNVYLAIVGGNKNTY